MKKKKLEINVGAIENINVFLDFEISSSKFSRKKILDFSIKFS